MDTFMRPEQFALNPHQLRQGAEELPFGVAWTLGAGGSFGFHESYGIGTLIAANEIDQHGRKWIPDNTSSKYGFQDDLDFEGTDSGRWESKQELAMRGDEPLTQQQYQNSEWFRADLPAWNERMTVNRAKALAERYDRQRVKEDIMERRPGWGFVGEVAGVAFDPINYIPIVSPALKGMQGAGQLGRVSAKIAELGIRKPIATGAAAGALDATLNTAIFGIATMDYRRSLGSQYATWEHMLFEIAASAGFGGGLGALVGGISKARSRPTRRRRPTPTRDDTQPPATGDDGFELQPPRDPNEVDPNAPEQLDFFG